MNWLSLRQTTPSDRSRWSMLQPFMVWGGVILLSVRLLLFINHYAVNLLFWDQWDYLKPIFAQADAWTVFSWQHSNHRQGLGSLLMNLWLPLSRWNTRLDAFMIGSTFILAALGALWLSRMTSKRYSLADLAIPLALLNLSQYDTLVGTLNISANALPVLLAVGLALVWTIEKEWLRLAIVLGINFLAIFTGHAYFLGLITLFLFLLQLVTARKSGTPIVLPAIGIAGSLASISLFLKGYVFQNAVECSPLAWNYFLRYPIFASLMQAKLLHLELGVSKIAAGGVGALMLAALVGALIHSLFRLTGKGLTPENRGFLSAAILVGFSLLFTISAAIGRTCMGYAYAGASRYVPTVALGFAGLSIYLQNLQPVRLQAMARFILAAALLATLLPLSSQDQGYLTNLYYNGKKNWIACYLEHEDLPYCYQQTHFRIYPDLNNPSVLQELKILKDNRLNFYSDALPGSSRQAPSP